MKIAEKIRQAARNESIILADLKQQKATVSIAVAPFDGHPDYQRLIDRAEHVLGKVHEMGPDQCLLDAGSHTGSN
jgi:diguanylate cyclase